MGTSEGGGGGVCISVVGKQPCQISMYFHDSSKNRYRKIYFSFDSAHCKTSMKMGAKLRGGGSAYPYLGQGQDINKDVFYTASEYRATLFLYIEYFSTKLHPEGSYLGCYDMVEL